MHAIQLIHGKRIIKIVSTLADNAPENFTNPHRLAATAKPFDHRILLQSFSSLHTYTLYEWCAVSGEHRVWNSTRQPVTPLPPPSSSSPPPSPPSTTTTTPPNDKIDTMRRAWQSKVECNAITVFKWSSFLYSFGTANTVHHLQVDHSLIPVAAVNFAAAAVVVVAVFAFTSRRVYVHTHIIDIAM